MPDSIPKYLPAVVALAEGAPPGRVQEVFVLHDADCPLLLAGGACACTPEVTRGFVLWWRKNRRCAWQPVATGPTEAACYAAMRASGKRHGDWLALEAGKQP